MSLICCHLCYMCDADVLQLECHIVQAAVIVMDKSTDVIDAIARCATLPHHATEVTQQVMCLLEFAVWDLQFQGYDVACPLPSAGYRTSTSMSRAGSALHAARAAAGELQPFLSVLEPRSQVDDSQAWLQSECTSFFPCCCIAGCMTS